MTIYIGNAPCSWGTLEFGSTQSNRISYQQMLDELVETGYVGSELGDWDFMPTDLPTLCDAFAQRNLAITGAFVGVALRDPAQHAPGQATVLRTARQLADLAQALQTSTAPFLVLADDNGTDPQRTANAGRITPGMSLRLEEWRVFADGANRIARAVQKETGLPTVFHHHCAGFVETPDEIAQLLELTDPDLLGLVFDTGHYAFGAGGCSDVGDALERFAPRIRYLHFKDCHPLRLQEAKEQEWDYFTAVAHGVFCELGRGCVDFSNVRNWLRAQNYHGFVTVEQDVLPGMGSPKESAARNRAYLRQIEL